MRINTILQVKNIARMIILIIVMGTVLKAQTESVEKVLNTDGTIKTGITGSFNTAGYQMTLGKNNEPVFTATQNYQQTNSYTWGKVGSGRNGTNGTVYAFALDDSGNVYVGGSFTIAGDVPANNIAKWNGSSWSTLISGSSNGVNGAVNALAVSGTNVYVGGAFTLLGDGTTSTNRIAKWNGSSWSTLTSGSSNGVNATVYALAVSGTDIYVGGAFTLLGDGTTSANRIVKWNGSSWSTLTSGSSNGVNGTVYALAVSGTNVYVGGIFTLLGDGTTSANRIAKWNGSSWSTLPSGSSNGVSGTVYALAVSGTDLYVGGQFTLLGDGTTSAKNLAKWNGSGWSALPSGSSNGVNSAVYALAVSGTDIYVGGAFTLLGDGTTSAKYVAKWNGSSWSTLPSGSSNGVNSAVRVLAANGATVYAGGGFTQLGDGITSANYLIKWTGAWATVGSGNNGVSGNLRAIAVMGSDVYIGGLFTLLGDGTSAKNIAKWDGSSWSALPSGSSNGVNATVYALAVSGTDLYVGGAFTLLGDGTTSAKSIAKWNGSSWSTLPSGSSNGVNSAVYALAVSGTNIYVGGQFTLLGDGTTSAKYIAKWNGSSWSTLTSGSSNGVNSNVYALAVSGTGLYVGGSFAQLGDGTSANRIAKWNGSSWSTLPSGSSNGVNGAVNVLAVSGTNVYVGGLFTQLGDGTTSAKYIAKWDGSSWSTLTSGSSNGVNNVVYALAVSGTDLYVGGQFTLLGDGTTSAKYIAKWDGSSLSAIDNGVNNYVYAFAISEVEGLIYVGGNFTIANSTLGTYYICKLGDPSNTTLPVELTTFSASVSGRAVNLKWQTATEVNNYGFEVQKSAVGSSIAEGSWRKIGFVDGSGNSNAPKSYNFTDESVSAGKYLYRLKQVDNDGQYKYSDNVEVEVSTRPAAYSLTQNYPNPFNPSTRINYTIPENGMVTLKVYDITGREMSVLVNEIQPAGKYSVAFNGATLASGIYLYTLKSGKYTATKKLMLLK